MHSEGLKTRGSYNNEEPDNSEEPDRAQLFRDLSDRAFGCSWSLGVRGAFGMNSEELILVTGATGFLGVQLVRELLDRQSNARLALLIRDRPGQSGEAARRFDCPRSRALAR